VDPIEFTGKRRLWLILHQRLKKKKGRLVSSRKRWQRDICVHGETLNPKLSFLSAGLFSAATLQLWDAKGAPIHECGEPLIAVAGIGTSKVMQVSSYFAQGFQQASRDLFVRKEGWTNAPWQQQNELPSGLRIAIFDAWRSLELQQEIFSKYMEDLKARSFDCI